MSLSRLVHPLPPSLFPASRTVLLFPGEGASTIQQLVNDRIHHASTRPTGSGNVSSTDGSTGADAARDFNASADAGAEDSRLVVVVVDATWSQSKQILKDPALSSLPKLALGAYRTAFWRRQTLGENYLSTIEAVYYLCRGLHIELNPAEEYQGQYDNLLYLFAMIRNGIRQRYVGQCPTQLKGARCTKLHCQYDHSARLDSGSDVDGAGAERVMPVPID
jgi:hypothetical protein